MVPAIEGSRRIRLAFERPGARLLRAVAAKVRARRRWGLGRVAESKHFHFPLHVLDSADGSSRVVDLRAPFEGKLLQPETNYRGTGKAMHTRGGYGRGIGNLELDNARLLVTVSNSKQNWRLAFEIQ